MFFSPEHGAADEAGEKVRSIAVARTKFRAAGQK